MKYVNFNYALCRGLKKYTNPNLFQRFNKCVNFPVKLYRLQNWQRLQLWHPHLHSLGGLIVYRVIIVVRAQMLAHNLLTVVSRLRRGFPRNKALSQ